MPHLLGRSRARAPQGESVASEERPAQTKYRFGFVLSTAVGNLTRYQILRRFAEHDPEVESIWAPVKHYLAPGERDPFALLPGPVRTRAIVLHQAAPVLRRLNDLDAVMIHMYEVDIVTALRGYVHRNPLRIASTDDPPAIRPDSYPFHPVDLRKPRWRRAVRLQIDLWRARRADLHIPFSRWAADLICEGTGLDRSRVRPMHVGLELARWPGAEKQASAGKLKILFVGGDFERKGGHDLLAAFAGGLAERAELHLVTRSAPADVPAGVFVYSDLDADDERLATLYREADIFALPTFSDLSPWAVLEAMASRCAIVTTAVGGIGDLVAHGKTGLLVPTRSPIELAEAIRTLIDDPGLRLALGSAARDHVERHYDARINVPQILGLMKAAVDQRRGEPGRHRPTRAR